MLADNPGLGRSCDEIYPHVFISRLENTQLISPKKKAYETPNVELLSDSMLLKIAIARWRGVHVANLTGSELAA